MHLFNLISELLAKILSADLHGKFRMAERKNVQLPAGWDEVRGKVEERERLL